MRRRAVILAALTTVAVAGTAVAATAPVRAWQDPLVIMTISNTTLGPGGLTTRGDALAAGTTSVGTRLRIVVANRRGFTAGWTHQTISGPLNGYSNVASAMNPSDAAVVLWRTPAHNVTSAVRTSRTGPWRMLNVPSGAAARDNSGFLDGSVAMTANGQASAIWYAKEQTTSTVRSAFRSGPAAVWRAMPALTPSAPPGSSVAVIHVAGDAAGDAVAAWSVVPHGGTTSTVYVATRSGHHAWTAPRAMPDTDVSGGGWIGNVNQPPSVSIAPNGRVAVAWTVNTTTDVTTSNVVVATGDARTGTLGPPEPLPLPGGLPSIAINSHGTLAAVWSQARTHDPLVADLHAAISPSGTTWTVPQTLHRFDGQEDFDYGHVVLGESGRAVATSSWNNGTADDEGLLMSSGLSGVWTDAFTGPVTGWPSVTLNTSGDALAVAAGTHAIFGVSLDAVPRPKLAVHVTPVWLPGHRQIRWTVRVTDVGPVTARKVALSVSWPNTATLISAVPAGRPTALGRAWALGTLAPGHSASVRVIIRPNQSWARYIFGQTSATGLAAHTFQVTAPA